MEKEKQIKKEIRKLSSIFKNLPPEEFKLLEGLIQNAAFMRVTLDELREEVIERGAMIEYVSGNGFNTIRDNPAQKAYTTMISRYSAVISQLASYLPDGSETDELEEWLNK